MKAVILAAGFGTRLWPLTAARSKPAIPFLNRPLISYCVNYLASYGIRDIIVNLHHQPDSIRAALGDGSQYGASISYSYEEQILGTSGALDRVRESLLGDDFVVINGKIVTTIDLAAAIRAHRQHAAIATLVLRRNIRRERFSIVEVDDRNRIRRFGGFPDGAATGEPPLMFTGIQVLSPRIFDYVPKDQFSHSTVHVYPPAIEAGEAVIGHLAVGDWYEMSTLDRYLDASLALMGGSGDKHYISGAGTVIGAGATVEDSVLWDNVLVGRGARVHRSIIADRVCIPDSQVIERAAVVRRDSVSELERGTVVGDNLIVPL